MTLQTFYVIGGHCPRSKEDTQTIINYFLENGLTLVKKIKKADIICVYTCGGFNATEKSSVQTINGILQQKSKNATVIITGCLLKINPESMNNFKDSLLMEFKDLEQLDAIIHSKIPFKQIPNAGIIGNIPRLYGDIKINQFYDSLKNPKFIKNIPEFLHNFNEEYIKKTKTLDISTKETYHIRISRGCQGNCSYCSIKLAHGRLQSKPIEQIQKDFKIGLQKGYKIFKIVGTDIGGYGIDINTNIVEVLKIFFNLPGNNKIILPDFHPRWFIKYYDQLEPLFIANYEKVISLRLPIESGSNNILKRMRRPYKIEDVKKYVSAFIEKIPKLKIYTHIIVGFPGETDEDFQQTLNLLKEIQFFSVSLFPYSDRPMTDSFKMDGKIPSEVIRKRVNKIKSEIKQGKDLRIFEDE